MNDDIKAGVLILGFVLIVLGSLTVGTLYRDKITSECKLKALDKSLSVAEIKELCA